MKLNNLDSFYCELDGKFNITNNELTNATYINTDSNFVKSFSYARHRWFNYKEGFSPVLVQKIFDEYELKENSLVCDPFCGAGTTLLVAKANGINSIGFEVNPFATFITKVKTDDYTNADMKIFSTLVKELRKLELHLPQEPIDNEYMCRIFDKEMLEVQLNIRAFVLSQKESKAKNLLRFAWICTLESCSLYRKAGNGLKKKTRPPKYAEGNADEFAISAIEKIADVILLDFEENINDAEVITIEDSASTIENVVSPNSLDLVLFSPPYANCFDYTKIYILELWFGGFINEKKDQSSIRMKSIRSHCHATWPERYENFYLEELHEALLPILQKKKLWTNRIPGMLNGYFADMHEVLSQIYVALKPGGSCSIVVSNSSYAGVIIPTDTLLARVASEIGFKVDEISVERLIITSSQQYKETEPLKKYLRESIIKLKK